MIFNTAHALLIVGLAGRALTESTREPYLARMSTREIFGLHRRVIEGYSPTEQLCGDGDSCAEACGKGFRQCASDDGLTHCYNRRMKQTCCPGGSGDSCDNGYYCSADDEGRTWCCPEGLTLGECAQKYDIPGPLTSEEPLTSTTTTTSTTKSTESTESSKPTTTSKTTKKPKTTTTEDTSTSEISATSTAESTTTNPAKTRTGSRKPDETATSKSVRRTSTTMSESEEASTTTPSTSSTTVLIAATSTPDSIRAAATEITTPAPVPSSTPSATPAPSSTSIVGANGGIREAPANVFVLFMAGVIAAIV